MATTQQSPSLRKILAGLMLQEVPSYANKIYYSLGFLSMTSFLVLLVSGLVLVFNGPGWWLTTQAGVYARSVHLWAAQAFILFIILHATIVFLTSGYKKPRRLTWVLGSIMFFLALVEAEFGYGLRGDFSSQWRALQASDLYNGAGLGASINNLNYAQIYGIHIVFIPLIILALLFLHYTLVKVRGIAVPFRTHASYTIVKADHKILFLRGAVLIAAVLVLAAMFKSPTILPVSIQEVANDDPAIVAKTLVNEFTHTSDTATYLDNIDPYTYDTKEVYVAQPYRAFVQAQNSGGEDALAVLDNEQADAQQADLQRAADYFQQGGALDISSKNPAVALTSSLTKMAQSGLYESLLRANQNAMPSSNDLTYATRFLSDTGVLADKAQALNMTTDQYGMLHEEKGALPLGAWWLAPVGFFDHTLLANDENQDRDGAEILGLLILLFIAFPYIPYLNKIPEKLAVDKYIWKDKTSSLNT